MRTTVEMKAEHRAALLALAAERGEKGLSGILAEAIEGYLAKAEGFDSRMHEFLSLEGSLDEEEANALRASTRALRESWR